MIGPGPTGSGAVGGADGERVVRRRSGLIREQTFAVAHSTGANTGDEEAGRLEITRRFARFDCRARCFGAAVGSEISGRVEIGFYIVVLLRPERRHRFRIVGRKLRQRLGLTDGALESRVLEVVRRNDGVFRSKRGSERSRLPVETPPAVEMRLSAKRMFALYPPPTFTWIDSALDILTIRSTNVWACSRVRTRPSAAASHIPLSAARVMPFSPC